MAIILSRDVNRLVVFDAIAYRGLVEGASPDEALKRARKLVKAEKEMGLQGLGFSTVLLELLAGVADPDAEEYESAKAALFAALQHIEMWSEKKGGPFVWASAELQLCLSLFQRWPEELLETDDLVRELVETIHADPAEKTLESVRSDLRKADRTLRSWRHSFASSLRENIEKPLTPGAVAEAHVARAASLVPREVSDDDVSRMARRIARKFDEAVAMYRLIVEKVRGRGHKLTGPRGAELLWNLQVAFVLGDEHKLDGNPTLVVTGDEEVAEAAQAGDLRSRIIPLSKYGKYRELLAAAAE